MLAHNHLDRIQIAFDDHRLVNNFTTPRRSSLRWIGTKA